MKQLHPTQQQLLDILKANVTDPLTVREIQEALDISSPSVVHHHIKQLEKRGYLKRNPSNPKDYQIMSDREKPIVYLNMYGLAQCGPNGSILEGDPEDRIPIASKLIRFPSDQAFLMEASGDSMQPKINEGDLVIAQISSTAKNGDTVVCVNDSMALIKKFFLQNDQIVLQSENPNYAPIIADPNNFRIEGLVKGVIGFS